jgi:hypothetical protein
MIVEIIYLVVLIFVIVQAWSHGVGDLVKFVCIVFAAMVAAGITMQMISVAMTWLG